MGSSWTRARTCVPCVGKRILNDCTTRKALYLFFVCLFFNLFIYLLMAVLGLRFCVRAFSSCGRRGPLFIAVCGPLTIAASLVAEHRLQTRRLSSCGSWAQLLRGMWDPPRPGLEPVSPASAGRLSTTAPPGKPYTYSLIFYFNSAFSNYNVPWGSQRWIQWHTACLIYHTSSSPNNSLGSQQQYMSVSCKLRKQQKRTQLKPKEEMSLQGGLAFTSSKV